MTIFKHFIGIALLSTLISTNIYPVIGGLIETASRTATGAVDLAADTATGTVRAVTEPRILPDERISKYEDGEKQIEEERRGIMPEQEQEEAGDNTNDYRIYKTQPRYSRQGRVIHQ